MLRHGFLTSIESSSGTNSITFDYYPIHEVIHQYNNELHELTDATDMHYYQIHNRTNLKQIIYKDRRIIFNRTLRYDALNTTVTPNQKQEYKLTSIELKNASGALIKKFEFNTAIYSDRLFLESIQQFNGEGDSLPLYEFDYIGPSQLPHRLSRQIDHWGYYNGQSDNDNYNRFISDQTYYNHINQSIVFHDGANREVYPSFAKYGVLNKITYPTGGYTIYDYESNDYFEVVHSSEYPDEDTKIYLNIVPNTALTNIAMINSESFYDDGASPIIVSVRLFYECKGTYLDYNVLFVGSSVSNQDGTKHRSFKPCQLHMYRFREPLW